MSSITITGQGGSKAYIDFGINVGDSWITLWAYMSENSTATKAYDNYNRTFSCNGNSVNYTIGDIYKGGYKDLATIYMWIGYEVGVSANHNSFGYNLTEYGTSPSPPTPTAWTVSYNKNTSDTVTNMPSNQTKYKDSILTLSSNIPLRDDFDFVKWNSKSDGTGTDYMPGSTYTANENITLYALWSDSGKLRIFLKNLNIWKKASPYIYINGIWKKSKPYVRILNNWKKGK